MKARGLGTRNSIVNFLPVFEKYSSFERTGFFIVMLTDALELRETSHFLDGPAVIHLDFPHTPGPWFLQISEVQCSLVRNLKNSQKYLAHAFFTTVVKEFLHSSTFSYTVSTNDLTHAYLNLAFFGRT